MAEEKPFLIPVADLPSTGIVVEVHFRVGDGVQYKTGEELISVSSEEKYIYLRVSPGDRESHRSPLVGDKQYLVAIPRGRVVQKNYYSTVADVFVDAETAQKVMEMSKANIERTLKGAEPPDPY